MNVAVVDDRTEEREKLKRLLAEYAAESGTEQTTEAAICADSPPQKSISK